MSEWAIRWLSRLALWQGVCSPGRLDDCPSVLSITPDHVMSFYQLTTPVILTFSDWQAHPPLLETWLWGEEKT